MSENIFKQGDDVRVTLNATISSALNSGLNVEVKYVGPDTKEHHLIVPRENVSHADIDLYKIPGRKIAIVKGLIEIFHYGTAEEALEEADRQVQEDIDHETRTVFVIPEEFLNNALCVEYIGTKVSTHENIMSRATDDDR